MGDIASFCLLSIAVFCGAFVSGLAGFAFSAVAGAILLHVLPPLEAVPLMMACSITVQAANLWALGLAIACYAAYTLFRPVLSRRLQMNVGRNVLIGFGGGFVGGLTAMPGAIPTIWCDIHGVPKTEQRGLVQPFIAAMQIFALVLMLLQNDLSSKVLVEFVASIPALFAGAALGIFAFRCVNEASFRRIILTMLLFSGLLLVL
jgi:uncharacterized membrane protein YfcA